MPVKTMQPHCQNRSFCFLLGLVLLTISGAVSANGVWRYVDEQGVLHFSTTKEHPASEIILRDPAAQESRRASVEVGPVLSEEQASQVIGRVNQSASYKDVQDILQTAAAEHNLEYELLKAIVIAESAFNPKAVSPKGAVGLMQIMPATARRYGVQSADEKSLRRELTEPRVNVATGARYLVDLFKMFPGRHDLILAAYNAGENAVKRAGFKVPNYRETQGYVGKVLALYEAQKRHGR